MNLTTIFFTLDFYNNYISSQVILLTKNDFYIEEELFKMFLSLLKSFLVPEFFSQMCK